VTAGFRITGRKLNLSVSLRDLDNLHDVIAAEVTMEELYRFVFWHNVAAEGGRVFWNKRLVNNPGEEAWLS
jgi:hypothetical protein